MLKDATNRYNEITREQFNEVNNKYQPNKWIKLGFKYFSKSTKPEDKHVNRKLKTFLFVLFLIGLFGTFFNAPKFIIGLAVIPLTIIIFALVTYMTIIVKLNNLRLKKIMKELNINLNEYNYLVLKFSF